MLYTGSINEGLINKKFLGNTIAIIDMKSNIKICCC